MEKIEFGERKNQTMKIRRQTLNELKILKGKLDMKTNDEVIMYLIKHTKSK